MAKFRKKPIEIEAVKWNGFSNNLGLTDKDPLDPTARYEKPDWLPPVKGELSDRGLSLLKVQDGEVWRFKEELYIGTLEGSMRVSVGDWIIKGAHGELYPCKPDIFTATYEAA
jgi:hypothetical protein